MNALSLIHTADAEGAADSDEAGSTSSPDEPGESDSTGDPDQPPPERRGRETTVEVLAGSESHGDTARLPLVAALTDALTHIEQEFQRVTVRIVGDVEMTLLHARHCGIDGPTDVLTFDATARDSQGHATEPVSVDIAICIDEARRKTAEQGHDVERELLLYALHGVLHCAGHDDHDDRAFQRMHAEEDRILTAIGVGAAFDRTSSTRRDQMRPDANPPGEATRVTSHAVSPGARSADGPTPGAGGER